MELRTLGEFIIERQNEFENAKGNFSALLRDISVAAKIVNRVITRAALTDIIGASKDHNASGEQQQKLDVYANDWFKRILSSSEECCGFASEEEDSFVGFGSKNPERAKYVVIFDPLDGSSNIDVNISIGTIFSIFRRKSEGYNCDSNDFFQQGLEQVAAGYVLYGTSTMLVYTTGDDVNGFTLYPSIGEFCLSHPDMKIPSSGSGYSINQGYYNKFPEKVKNYVDKRVENGDSLRFVGSMVADVHRTLLRGGIFIYPSLGSSFPNGKLRLLYECNPLALIIEKAGGRAVTDEGIPILSLKAESLHERTSIVIGSTEDVDDLLNS